MAGTENGNGNLKEVNDQEEVNQEVNDQEEVNDKEVIKEVDDTTKAAATVVRPNSLNCTLEFIGACQEDPRQAGAGAVVREGRKVYCVREGLGNTTDISVAEYKALILGLNLAVRKGYKHIRVIGDSRLVINQEQNVEALRQANLGLNLEDGVVEEEEQ